MVTLIRVYSQDQGKKKMRTFISNSSELYIDKHTETSNQQWSKWQMAAGQKSARDLWQMA